jgi:serine/threonine protein kinase
LDIDTRSDIYSLGVLLCELLTGSTPFDSETLRKAAFDEMQRIIREEEPPRPSTRLGSLGATLTTVSASLGAAPHRLGRAVRGALDWIAMKAREKDRRRRYETAIDFAADVLNCLAGRWRRARRRPDIGTDTSYYETRGISVFIWAELDVESRVQSRRWRRPSGRIDGLAWGAGRKQRG